MLSARVADGYLAGIGGFDLAVVPPGPTLAPDFDLARVLPVDLLSLASSGLVIPVGGGFYTVLTFCIAPTLSLPDILVGPMVFELRSFISGFPPRMVFDFPRAPNLLAGLFVRAEAGDDANCIDCLLAGTMTEGLGLGTIISGLVAWPRPPGRPEPF